MAKSEEGPDQDSIKPVSSLRSLFESKTAQEPGTIIPFTIPATRAIGRHDATQAITRASLDIPRPVSPWSASDDTSATHLRVTPGPPIARPTRPHPRVLQRPLSTTALTEPRSPPLLTVESPQAPPETPGNGSTQYLLRSPLAKPLTSVSIEPTVLRAAPVPPRRLLRVPTTSSQLLVADEIGSAQELGPIHRATDENPIQNTPKSFPPPVNRADKPKIPAKPDAISHKVNLEPLTTPVERVSPFSTPPSSDDSVSHGSPWATPLNRGTTPPVRVNVATEIHSHSPSRSWSAQGKVLENNTISPAKIQRPDARSFGFNTVSAPNEARLEDRPNLPPRGPREQRISAVHNPKDQKHTSHNATQRPTRSVSPRNIATELHSAKIKSSEFLPPPKRVPPSKISGSSDHHRQYVPSMTKCIGDLDVSLGTASLVTNEIESSKASPVALEYPDASITNRRPPQCKRGIHEIDIGYDCRHVDMCGNYVATAGHLTRAWDLRSGNTVLSLGHLEKEIRVTSMAFKPGAKVTEEGLRLWIGTNHGNLQELDILTNNIVHTKTGAHERREIVKIYRHQAAMWTLDDSGKLCVWSGGDTGVPDLQHNPSVQRVPKGHTFSIKIQDNLWLATGREIRIIRPSAIEAATSLVQEPLSQTGVGVVTSGAVISGQLDRVYFGHADGKVTIYSTLDFTCLSIVQVSIYKISSLAGAGFHLWAGYNTGMVYVYDTRTQPWTTRKEWLAHSSPVLSIVTDRSSLWNNGMLRVASLGADNALRIWDGTLEDDWIDDDMQDHDIEYASFREITALVVTWNAGAATPTHLRYEESEPQFFQTILQSVVSPDLLVFGFQELVDLEDKKLTAKNLFKGNKKKDPSEQEHMSRQYRAWRDYLVRCIEDVMPSNEPYHLLHTASMVGLFSCVFIKGSQRSQVRDVSAAEIKRGMGGLHGNKGALVMRLILDDSSLCLVNCHLAAGQTQTVNRNNDLTAILETALLPPDRGASSHGTYIGGGDGSMVLDNEICILNGDLNYRIDTMGRDTVVKAVKSNNLSKLLERDQLLVSRRRNPLFRARAFKECPITFAPTYKYDVGSDNYDTSEKRRAPAWCDRILYRGPGNIKQIDYCRHELWLSDHRPVSGIFKIRVKKITEDERAKVWQESKQRFGQVKERLATEAKIEYLRDVLGVPLNEAQRLL